MAQTPHFAVAASVDHTTGIYTDDGRHFEVVGDLVNFGSDGTNIWTLTTTHYAALEDRYYRIYKNKELRKTYRTSGDVHYSSVAMRVKDGQVIVAGSIQ